MPVSCESCDGERRTALCCVLVQNCIVPPLCLCFVISQLSRASSLLKCQPSPQTCVSFPFDYLGCRPASYLTRPAQAMELLLSVELLIFLLFPVTFPHDWSSWAQGGGVGGGIMNMTLTTTLKRSIFLYSFEKEYKRTWVSPETIKR